MLQQGGSKLPGGQLHQQTPTSTHHGPAHVKPLSHHHCKLGMSRLQMFSQAFVSWRRDFPSLNIDTTMQISPSFTTPPHQPYTKPLGLSHSTSHPLLPDLPAKGEPHRQHQHSTMRCCGTSTGLTCHWFQANLSTAQSTAGPCITGAPPC